MKKLLLILLFLPMLGFGQNVNIPDANFKAYLVGNTAINTNGDAEIQVSEANAFGGAINCTNMNIADLTGIEEFTSLTYLSCNYNSLTSLDVSQNTALTELHCHSQPITNLIANNNTALTRISCSETNLMNIDVSGATALSRLGVALSNLTYLDVSTNTDLTWLACSNNQLTSLDLSSNTALTKLSIGYNQLNSLDVRNGNNTNIDITYLWIENNPNLFCINVDDSTYSSNNWTVGNGNIDSQHYFSNDCGYIDGCTDALACNYDSIATMNDGSCIYLSSYIAITVCDSYTWNGTAYTNSGTYTYNTTNANGCDSTATLNLTINTSTTSTSSATACDTYTWSVDGNAYTTSGTYTDVSTNAAGCDHTETLELTINSVLASISQSGDNLSAVTTPIGLDANWYNIQTEDGTSRIWLMKEESSTYKPTFDCSYFIVVEDMGCTDTSEIYSYGENAARIGSFITSPNPTTGLINVKFDNPKNQFVMLEIISNNGSKLDEFITIENNLDVDLSKYPSGTYYLYFDSEDAVQGCRLEEVQKISTKIILNK